MPELKTLLKRIFNTGPVMDRLDLIISLDMLSLPAALPVFNLVDALRISSSMIVSSRIGSFNFANSAILDTLKSNQLLKPTL